MSSSDPVGHVLFTTPIHPMIGTFLTFANGDLDFMTPLKFVSFPCRMWSGSMKFKLQVVASAFHSARVQITYRPNSTGFGTDLTIDELFELSSHIIDIQRDSEIEFEIPWCSDRPALPIDKNRIAANFINGTMDIVVLNTLTYKDSPIPDISFNLWVSAGKDYKLYSMTAPISFDLTTPSSTLVNGGVAQIAKTSRATNEDIPDNLVPFVMGGFTEYPVSLQEVSLSNAMQSTSPVVFLDSGEVFRENNLRHVVASNSQVLTSTNYLTAYISDISPSAGTALSFSYYDWYMLMFRYRRGGYIYTMYSIDVEDPVSRRDSPSVLLAISSLTDSGLNSYKYDIRSATFTDLLSATNMPTCVSTRGSLQPLSVHIPFSSTSKMAINSCYASGNISVLLYSKVNVFNTVALTSRNAQCVIYRSPDKEMKYYFQVGAPAVFTPN
jgi:hypothetical protein